MKFLLELPYPLSYLCYMGRCAAISSASLLLLLILPTVGKGQAFGPHLAPETTVLTTTGDSLENPWAGGLNAVQLSRFDADRDGKKDLLVFDRSGNKVEIFLQRQEQGSKKWVHSEAFDEDLPSLSDWVLCRDFDQDGDQDLFTSNSGGIALFENTSNGAGPLEFVSISTQLLSDHYPADPSTGPINIYVQNADIPAIDDIDRDGDLDILSFHILGGQVEYHKNTALEQGMSDTLIYERRNACWGYFSEGAGAGITLDDSCSGNVQNPEGVLRHSGSTLLTLNTNGDSAKELMLGDLGTSDLVLLRNGGGPFSAHMDQVNTPFPNNNPVDLKVFPGSFYLDVNHNGVRDLVVSPNKENTSNNRKSIWLYRNEGSDSIPAFVFDRKNFLQKGMLDFGEGAYPEMVDIDGDGDLDLFVGNELLFEFNSEKGSSITFIENIGTSSSPAFQVVNEDYQNFSQKGMGDALHPSFGDLDGDGDPDLLIGDSDGYLHYFENSSPVGAPASYTLVTPQYKDAQGQVIDVGQFATPSLVDLDRDSTLDLVIGEKSGNLVHYENTGTSNSPSFKKRTDSLGKVHVVAPGGYEGYSVPSFFEDSGEYELLVGSRSGRIHYYKNIESNLSGTFKKVTDAFGNIDDGKRSSPVLAELNGDQRPEMILGDHGGGLHFYRGGDTVSSSITSAPKEEEAPKLWPNPVSSGGKLQFRSTGKAHSLSDLILYNLQGERIPLKNRGNRQKNRISVRLPQLEPGLYFIRFRSSDTAHEFIVR